MTPEELDAMLEGMWDASCSEGGQSEYAAGRIDGMRSMIGYAQYYLEEQFGIKASRDWAHRGELR